jgi:hypothetical protein
LFLRLNPVCSLWGLPDITYHLSAYEGTRVSASWQRRQQNFERLLSKHRPVFMSHSRRAFADFVFNHAVMLNRNGQLLAATKAWAHAFWIHPIQAIARLGSPYKQKLLQGFSSQNPLPGCLSNFR